MELRDTSILVGMVWNYGATTVEELGERARGLIFDKITETESRGRWGDLGHYSRRDVNWTVEVDA